MVGRGRGKGGSSGAWSASCAMAAGLEGCKASAVATLAGRGCDTVLIDGLAATQVRTGVLLQAQGGFVLFLVSWTKGLLFFLPAVFFFGVVAPDLLLEFFVQNTCNSCVEHAVRCLISHQAYC